MKTIEIHTAKPYNVHIGSGLLADTGRIVRDVLPQAVRAAVVTDSNVGPIYLKTVRESLEKAGFGVSEFTFQAGEENKNLEMFGRVLSFLAQSGITRSDCVIALGGGVTGDLTGFSAASYLRGTPYVQIPTSLLAMVDSSVGGKTAVDLPEGKNLAGAFCQPEVVVCDPDVLETLPGKIFCDGCAEVIKYGLLEDPELLDHLIGKGPAFDREKVIARCVAIKGDYVSRDERDNGERRKLNLGHTFGHAIEAASSFAISHGQAVAAGMCIMARSAAKRGLCREDLAEKIRECVARFGLPEGSSRDAGELSRYVTADKKRRGDNISLIAPVRAGRCEIVTVPVSDIEEWMREGLEG